MIQVKNLSKTFGEVKALRDVSFSIREGEIFGLLGPNGAGKSTTINILNTLLEADSGEVLIDGMDTRRYKDACKRIIGVVPQEIALYQQLSAYDNLLFWGGLYGLDHVVLKAKADEILDLVGLSERKHDAVKTYSGGMKRRINIASSLLHHPKVLLMDEPTVGVDPQSRNYVFELIEALNDKGMTIIYTTHYMEEAERLCDRIGIIDSGEIIAQGNLEELKANSDVKDVLVIKISTATDSMESLIPHAVYDEHAQTLRVACTHIGQEIGDIVSTLQNAGVLIERIDTEKANLETVFLKLTGKTLRD